MNYTDYQTPLNTFEFIFSQILIILNIILVTYSLYLLTKNWNKYNSPLILILLIFFIPLIYPCIFILKNRNQV